MRIPCSTCTIDLNTYTVYDKHGNIIKSENNEVELEYRNLKTTNECSLLSIYSYV